jgi:hypothetical protein
MSQVQTGQTFCLIEPFKVLCGFNEIMAQIKVLELSAASQARYDLDVVIGKVQSDKLVKGVKAFDDFNLVLVEVTAILKYEVLTDMSF